MTSVIVLSIIFLVTVLFVGKFTRFHVPDNDREVAQED